MTRQAVLRVASLGVLLVGVTDPAWAQEKSYTVGGRVVTLQVSPDYFIARPTEPVSEWRPGFAPTFAVKGIQAQAGIINPKSPVYEGDLDALKKRSVALPRAGAVLIPRLQEIGATPGAAAQMYSPQVAESIGATRVEPAFRYPMKPREGAGGKQVDKIEADKANPLVVPTGTLTVRFKAAPPPEALAKLEKDFKVRQTTVQPKFASHVYRFVRGPQSSDAFVISDMLANRKDLGVLWAEPDFVVEFARCGDPVRKPKDKHFDKQWYLQDGDSGVKLPQAWAKSVGKQEVIVAVIDDGVDLLHPDLQGQLVAGRDFLDLNQGTNPQPAPGDAHGTACAGIIAARADNDAGIAGIAWNSKVMPIRIYGRNSDGVFTFIDYRDVADAIHHAVENKARVINCSWGGPPVFSAKVETAIDEAVARGCLVIFSAGNGSFDVLYPASYKNCLAVGAVKEDGTRWEYSCYGPGDKVWLVAPSGDVNLAGTIFTLDHSGKNGYNPGGNGNDEADGDYTRRFGGTSAAAPVVSGVAALIWSTFPDLTADEVRECLEKTAVQVDQLNGGYDATTKRSKFYGFGKVNAEAALAMAATKAAAKKPPGKEPPAEQPRPESPTAARPAPVQAPRPHAPARGGILTRTVEAQLQPAERPDLLKAIDDNRPQSYTTNGRKTTLTPVKNDVWVAAPIGDGLKEGSVFWNAVDRARVKDPDRPGLAVTDRRGGVVYYLIPKTLLRPETQLRQFAAQGRLPRILTVYDRGWGGPLLYPGTLTVMDVRSEVEQKKLCAFAKEKGIEVVHTAKTEVELRITDKSSFDTVFAATAAIQKLGFEKIDPTVLGPLNR